MTLWMLSTRIMKGSILSLLHKVYLAGLGFGTTFLNAGILYCYIVGFRKIRDGDTIRFWKELWLEDTPLSSHQVCNAWCATTNHFFGDWSKNISLFCHDHNSSYLCLGICRRGFNIWDFWCFKEMTTSFGACMSGVSSLWRLWSTTSTCRYCQELMWNIFEFPPHHNKIIT